MRFVCDAEGGKTWFRIETEAEAARESELMRHAVEKHFRRAHEQASQAYGPRRGLSLSRTSAGQRTSAGPCRCS